ncbi:IPT/TIG domain-containing protein [Leptospira idonii]|uniref:IPT/TIG domain-containing protein n=1 Tax=Leptospira idonii TaxID=1193500 RepID=A0A4R9LZ66_9LEPT|nr:IPT/TIG domain-containing protein [Leptospira idonii]TGN19650.1 hypothetical protein EHS15_07665 [Leptospira idonii]
MKITKLMLTIFLFLVVFSNCKKSKSDDTTPTFLLLYLYQQSNADFADFYPELGFPGTKTTITGSDFIGSASDYTITVGGISATGITPVNASTIQFTMPELSGYNDNTTVNITVTRSGTVLLSKTIRYRPAVEITVNQPNSIVRALSSRDTSSFFKVVVGSSADHLFNAYGYAGANLDFYYLTSPTSSVTTVATSSATDTEFKRVTPLAAGTYYFQVKHISGGNVSYKMSIANSDGVVATSTNNNVNSNGAGSYLCYDSLGTGSANVAGSCDVINAADVANRTGKCTYPSTGGITTRTYYGNGFQTSYAQFTCLTAGNGSMNESESIFKAFP